MLMIVISLVVVMGSLCVGRFFERCSDETGDGEECGVTTDRTCQFPQCDVSTKQLQHTALWKVRSYYVLGFLPTSQQPEHSSHMVR